MESYLDVQHLTKSFGEKVLFDDMSFSVSEGQKVGLVARNGTGKSTLLSILHGDEGYDAGQIVYRNDIRVGYLEQTPHFNPTDTVLDACFNHEGNPEKVLRAKQVLTQLRIEDLDDRCKRPELAAQLIDDLTWLGLEWDEGPYYQHDRLDLYEDALRQLQDARLTYPCFCTRAELHAASAPHASDGTPIYRGACRGLSAEEITRRSALRAPATRLRVPTVDDLASDVIEFVDRTYGAQCEALATECGDFLVRRSDGVFAYQLAVVVDDAAMDVTEVVRGCDLLGSTPRQIYLQHLLGLPTPHYAHIPLLMSPDGRRLSKRDRDLDLGELRARFGAPEALLGWLTGQTGIAPDATPRSAEQLVEHFSWDVIRAHRENVTITAE